MKKNLTFCIFGFFLTIFFFFLLPSFTFGNPDTLCSYAGPDLSEDLLRLTNFSITGPSSLKEGDTITVKFKLQNFGQYDLKLGQKGIFVAVRDPNNSDVSFTFTRANTTLKVGETILIEATKVLDKDGNWKIWPSYQISLANGEKLGPDNWHVCSLQVGEVVKDSDQDGISDEKDNCPNVYNPDQKNSDGDSLGDVCDDSDQDGVMDDKDNCLFVPNSKQEDFNKNGVGDACEQVTDSDKDEVPDQEDNCPQNYNPQQEDIDGDNIGNVCDSCDDRDSDQDRIKNCLDKCPDKAENYNQYQDDDGCPDQVPETSKDSDGDGILDEKDKCPKEKETFNKYQDDDGCPDEAPKAKDTTAPTITISHTPPEVDIASNITFEAIAQDNTSVSKIVIYVNEVQVKECTPPDFAQGNWRCIHTGGPFPARTLTYKAEAFDPNGNKGVSSVGRIEVQTITFETPPVEVRLPCSISGKLLDFKYLSKTVRVKFCEAEVLSRTCSPEPPFTCFPGGVSCKRDGRTWYEDIQRVWTGEESYRNPGPLSYQTQVSCAGSYLIQPVYQPFGEECEWQGRWTPTKSNSVTMEGANKTDYNFRFSPLDLTAPGINVQTSNPSPPATFKGEGNFNLSVKASDPQGVKRIKISGNYQISFFQSTESGRLETTRVSSPIPIFKECNTSPCDIPIPYYEGGKSIIFNLKISACDNAGNKVETSYNRTFPDETGDLSIVSAEPIQVIYGAPLVKNKNTAFRIKVNSSFPHPVETMFRLTLPPDKWSMTSKTGRRLITFSPGWSFPDLWGPIKIPANVRNYEIMLPIIANWQKELDGTGSSDATKMLRGEGSSGTYGVDVRLMPVPKADRVNFSVEIDPNNQVRETNEGRNIFNSPNYDVVKTRAWRFLVVPYRDEAGCAPYRQTVEAGVKRYLEYLLAVYPIADSKLEYSFATTPYSQRCSHDPSLTCEYVRIMDKGASELRLWTAKVAKEDEYDFGIAVGCGGGGQANLTIMAVTVGDSGRDEVLAHEFNHAVAPVDDIYSLDCYSSWAESYCELPDGDRFYCCWQDYNDEKERRERNGIDPKQGCIIDCGQNDRSGCDYGCCRSRCETECSNQGGTIYSAPDLRTDMPAANGFWVNKWVKKEGKQYYMDGLNGDNWISARSVREEGYHFCPNPDVAIDYDGYLNMLTHSKFISATDPEALLVSGTIHQNGTVKFDPFVYLPEAFLDVEPGQEGDYYFVLLDNDNNILSKTGFDVYFYQSDPYGGSTDETGFVYRIEWKDGTKKIELQNKDGKVLASQEVSENKPEVKVIYPNGGEVFTQGKKIKIKWQANDKDNDTLIYSLSLSRNNGETWLPVDIDIKTNEYELNSLNLKVGDYLIKVRATDGVNSSEDISDGVFSVKVAKKVPTIYLIGGSVVLVIGIAVIIYRPRFSKKKKIEGK